MLRQLLMAICVALSSVSHQLLAAELEAVTPAAPGAERAAPAPERAAPARKRVAPARERAAPAAERAAPAREQAAPAERAPARERQATRERAPARQASNQPSQSSWTGSQVGGYGGGNAGGGGFSDKALLSQTGICNGTFTSASNPLTVSPQTASSTPMLIGPPSVLNTNMPCVPGPGASGSLPNKFTAAGVISFETPKIPIPLGGGMALLVGAVIDVGTGTSSSNFTQFNTYSTAPPIGPDAAGQRTNETINFTFRERVSSSLRAKIGVPILNYWALIYFTGGVAVAKTEASYSYTGTSFSPGCAPGSGCATNVVGSATFNQTRTGFSGGGGIEVQTGIPGVKVAFDYTYTRLGSISQTIPLVVGNCALGPGLCSGGAEQVNFSNLSTQRAVVGVKIGL